MISRAGVGDPNDEVIDHGRPEWQGAGIDDPGGDIAEFVVGVLAGGDQQLETLLGGQLVGRHHDPDSGADHPVAVQRDADLLLAALGRDDGLLPLLV